VEAARKHLEAVYRSQLEVGPDLTALDEHRNIPNTPFGWRAFAVISASANLFLPNSRMAGQVLAAKKRLALEPKRFWGINRGLRGLSFLPGRDGIKMRYAINLAFNHLLGASCFPLKPRIHIIGGPGSGKSYIAAKLSERFGVLSQRPRQPFLGLQGFLLRCSRRCFGARPPVWRPLFPMTAGLLRCLLSLACSKFDAADVIIALTPSILGSPLASSQALSAAQTWSDSIQTRVTGRSFGVCFVGCSQIRCEQSCPSTQTHSGART